VIGNQFFHEILTTVTNWQTL